MISFITGLPGAGKGVYSVLRIIDVLQTTDMPILTNFAIELNPWVRRMSRRRSRGEKGLLAHLRDTFGQTYNAETRIHVLTDKQIKDFYLWRVDHNGKLVEIAANRGKNGGVESLDEKAFSETVPCYYLVDEAWKFWNARGWQNVEGGFQFYNAQHRKAGDNLDITAQHASQIDKQMRVLVQEYHSLVNHGYRKMGIFKQPNVISVFISNEPPELRTKSLGAVPKIIRFDRVGIGGSFDTAKGAGVQGMSGDIERKRRGLPTWILPVCVVLGGAGIIFAARGAGWFAGQQLTGGVLKQQDRTRKEIGAEPKRPERVLLPKVDVLDVPSVKHPVAGVGPKAFVPEVGAAIKGWVKFGGAERILLDDGTVVDVPSRRCPTANYEMGVALVDGKMVGWSKMKARENEAKEIVRPMRGF